MALAHTSEGFYNANQFTPNDWTPGTVTASQYWVGSAPRLSTLDDATSFARVEVTDPDITYVTARLAPFTISGSIQVTGRVRFTGPWPDGTVFSLGLADPDVGLGTLGTTWGAGLFGAALDVWHTFVVDIGSVDAATLAAVASAGDLVVFGTGGRTWGTDGFDITYLEATAAGTPPLRLMQRGDGLGMGSGRVFGAGTRQGSIRVFGSL